MTNRDILVAFEKAAAVLSVIDDGPFRVRAYQRAIETIEQLDVELSQLMQSSKLSDLPGIGAELAQKIEDLVHTGTSEALERLYAKVPQGMFALMRVPTLGAKKAYRLSMAFDLHDEGTALATLKTYCEQGSVHTLDGFGKQSEQKILENIDKVKAKTTRMRLDEAERISEQVIDYLAHHEAVVHISALGSIRRRRDTVGDVDIGVATDNLEAVITFIKQAPFIEQVDASGTELVRLQMAGGIQVDLKVMLPEQWGSMLQHFTGSKQHNVSLREHALKQGKSLSEKGSTYDGRLHMFDDEKAFYAHLGLAFVEPELREGTDEVALALSGKLPNLVSTADIAGDMHMHTSYDWSSSHDYGAKPEDLFDVASSLGYSWLVLGDHQPSKASTAATSMHTQVVQRNIWIEQQFGSWKIAHENNTSSLKNVLKSLEVDILRDGTLAVDDASLKELDVVIASIHSSLDLDSQTQTKRLLAAVSHPLVDIIGHPSGRLIGNREGMNIDWEQVFVACVQHKTALEINAQPKRLDLPDSLVREAMKRGVMFSLGSDAHDSKHLRYMPYGVSVARRGRLEANAILNTKSYDELVAWLTG